MIPRPLNALAWTLVNAAPAKRDLARARALAERALKISPDNQTFRSTLVLTFSRLGLDAEAVALVEKAPNRGPWEDLVIAPCYHRLGHTRLAREALDSALKWRTTATDLTPRLAADFRVLAAEAEKTISGPPGDGSATPP